MERQLRANPAYELVLFDRLGEGERRALEMLRRDADFYGVLRPQGAPELGIKSVDCETALLFLTLREPGVLPSYVPAVHGEETGRAVARLVADGILEMAEGDAFVSGAAALVLLAAPASGDRTAKGGRLAELSRAALFYGQALELDDPIPLSLRLYGYNRRPLTPEWKRRLSDARAVLAFLGVEPGGPGRALLDAHWTAEPPVPGWIGWRPRRASVHASRSDGATYKLYLSPRTEWLAPETFARTLEALAACGTPHFKTGDDAAGLLRPDKIVVYFPSFDELARAVEILGEALTGAPAHGVPFTSEIGGDGLLSWGMDPPVEAGGGWTGRESWRLWLTHRLARALLAARGAAQAAPATPTTQRTTEPWRFALERLRIEGVDTDSWTPGARLFAGA